MSDHRRNILQGVEISTPNGGNSFPLDSFASSADGNELKPSVSHELELKGDATLSPLAILKTSLLSGEHPSENDNPFAALWSRAISIEQLELIEAELRNQGYFPHLVSPRNQIQPTLTQIATYESHVHRWRARRSGINADGIEFTISVPRYVYYLWTEVAQLMHDESPIHSQRFSARKLHWKALFPHTNRLASVTQQLERWAEVLIERSSSAVRVGASRYDRGHELLVNNIIQTHQPSEKNISLPIDPRTYLADIRSLSATP